jgi:hypothetical protein
MGKIRNVHKILVMKLKRKRPPWKTTVNGTWEDVIQTQHTGTKCEGYDLIQPA